MIISDLPHPSSKRLLSFEKACKALRRGFQENDTVDELKTKLDVAESIWESIHEELPLSESRGFADRHFHFIRYYLDEDNPSKCIDDSRDLIERDIPGIMKTVTLGISEATYHPKISERVFPPLKRQEFDSAVRRAFAVLKSELVEKFQVPSDIDGESLFNACFGRGGTALEFLGESESLALRNYLSGLSILYRNHFAHNDLDGEWTEAAAVIIGINSILLRLESIQRSNDREQV